MSKRFDGYRKSKQNYIKEERTDINKTKKGNVCELGLCMDIEQDRCSQFCNYYKKHAGFVKIGRIGQGLRGRGEYTRRLLGYTSGDFTP